MNNKKKRAKNWLVRRDVFFFNGMNFRNSLVVLATSPPPFFEILESKTQGLGYNMESRLFNSLKRETKPQKQPNHKKNDRNPKTDIQQLRRFPSDSPIF
ncbi:MAG: hypothetical protein GTN68_31030 [Candidatus Aminicenantes bacterium]|nr:hypothetical protein [Candidatus Aminicenantes bacterium]NIO84993.1 hypothetical protein [Candidatus Aminicenantes bacterium]NIQ70905.1 hypothetical protein [Candidatus Aminicenantes bacterium]